MHRRCLHDSNTKKEDCRVGDVYEHDGRGHVRGCCPSNGHGHVHGHDHGTSQSFVMVVTMAIVTIAYVFYTNRVGFLEEAYNHLHIKTYTKTVRVT